MKTEVKALLRELFARDLDDDVLGPTTTSREGLIDEYAEKIIATVRQTEETSSYRDASTGRFVTKEHADASPSTTFLDKIKKYVKG